MGATVLASAAAVVVAGLLVAGLLPPRTTGSVAPGDGTPLPIPTSQWREGDDGMAAEAEGVLVLRPDSCLVLVSDASELVIAWPVGFTAVQRVGGVDVLGADGSVVAREGERIALGGGEGRVGLSGPCLRGVTPVFAVNQAPPYDRTVATETPAAWSPVQAAEDLYGTWNPVEVSGRPARDAANLAGDPLTLRIGDGPRGPVLGGPDAACNQFSADFTIGQNGRLVTGDFLTTLVGCAPPEGTGFWFAAALKEARTAELSSGTPQQLRLLADDGTVLAVYERDAAPSASPAAWAPVETVEDLQGTWLATELGGEDVAGAVDLRGDQLVLVVQGSGLKARDGECNYLGAGLQVQDEGRLVLSPPSVTAVGCGRGEGWPAAGSAAYEAEAAHVLDPAGDAPRRLQLLRENGTVLGEYVEAPASAWDESTAGYLCLQLLASGDGLVEVTHARLTSVAAVRERTGGPSDTSPAAEPWRALEGASMAVWCTSRAGSTWSVTAVTAGGPPVTFMSAGTPLGDPGVDGPAIP